MIARSRRLAVLVAGACLACGVFAAAAHAAKPAWSPVGVSGPTVLPPQQSEVQKVFVDAEGGTFTLTARQPAASGIGDLVLNETTVTQVSTSSGAFAVGQVIEGFGILDGTTIEAVGVNTLTLSKSAIFREKQASLSSFSSPATTAPLAYNATAAAVQAALEGLAPIGAGNVEVSGGPGAPGAEDPYVVVFKGSLANTNVSQLAAGSGSLVGGASVVTPVSGGRGTSKVALMAQNVGGAPSSGEVVYKADLPTGITAIATPVGPGPSQGPEVGNWSCGGSTASQVLCTRSVGVRPGLTLPPILVTVTAAPGAESGVVEMEVVENGGGGAIPATAELPLPVSSTPAGPGVQTFVAGAQNADGVSDARAGHHPYSASAAIFPNTRRSVKGSVIPVSEFKDIVVQLPPGFLGNPTAAPACPESTPVVNCPRDTMVGVVTPFVQIFGEISKATPLFNTEAPPGYPAKFRFRVLETEDLNVVGELRSDEDYGVDAASFQTPEIDQVQGTFVTLWGEPAAASHNSVRCSPTKGGIERALECEPSTLPDNKAFLTNSSDCQGQNAVAAANGGLLPVGMTATFWQNPGQVFSNRSLIPPIEECDQLDFEPDFDFQPSATSAASVTGATAHIHVDQADLLDPNALAPPHLKKSVVTLPEGFALNPAAAAGLEACSTVQMGLKGTNFAAPNPIRFTKAPVACPDASKIGTAEIETPLLEDALQGTVYLAAQSDNPFKSLLAMYIVIEDEKTGTVVKLPGEVIPNADTGQLTAVFDNNPQVPFEDLELKFRGGANMPRSTLATPDVCAPKYDTVSSFTPWSAPESGPPATPASSFAITTGVGGTAACPTTKAERPFSLGFEAGSTNPIAGAHSPFTLRITRPDGNQELDKVTVTTPPGFAATLKGVDICSEAQVAAAKATGRTGKQEIASPSCPASSQVGTTTIGAGVGSQPLYVKTGKVYLTGPYNKAPVSLTFIVPAVAGPFDLGVQVVRTALKINPTTAQVTAESDSIPQILKGIPLLIRDVRVDLDRPGFALNPTSCEVMGVSGTVSGGSGATANLANRFQVGDCANLGFNPKLKIQLHGKTRRAAYQRLEATVTYPKGAYANIARAAVTLPHSEFLAQEHINTICTRVQFAAHQCPDGSIYGHAEAISPLIDGTISGPVYLRSSNNPLPDLVAALRGPDAQPIEVELAGRTDSVNGGIRNTFDVVPDVAVSKFTLKLFGGRKSLIVNSRNLCKGSKQRATAKFTAHNGKTRNYRPVVGNDCGKKKSGAGSKKHTKARGFSSPW